MKNKNYTKYFFSKKQLFCPICSKKNSIHKRIFIYYDNPFIGLDWIIWDFNLKQKIFRLFRNDKSINKHEIFIHDFVIRSLEDVENACKYIIKFGGKIDAIILVSDCINNHNDNEEEGYQFIHKYKLQYDFQSLDLIYETFFCLKNKITKDYTKNSTRISVNGTHYDFNSILDISLKDIKQLPTKINKILLLS